MLFRSAASLSAVEHWCKALRHGLGAGLSLPRVLTQQADKGPAVLRPVAQRIVPRIQAGESFEDALEPERGYFPPMFLDLVTLGERTGHLPEMCKELEEYFRIQQQLRRTFYSQITWPVFQFVAAVFVIAGLIFILGLIGESNNSKPIEPIGFGLSGAKGAITFLFVIFGGLASLYGAYWIFTRKMRGQATVERLLMRIPVIGSCIEALSLQRFCLALRLTLETGIPVDQALRRSIKASGNAVYMTQEDTIAKRVRKGKEIAPTLEKAEGFPRNFIEIVTVAEESGQVPEVMGRQAEHYREESIILMTRLTKIAGFGVWAMVAILIIFAIFQVAKVYTGALESSLR